MHIINQNEVESIAEKLSKILKSDNKQLQDLVDAVCKKDNSTIDADIARLIKHFVGVGCATVGNALRSSATSKDESKNAVINSLLDNITDTSLQNVYDSLKIRQFQLPLLQQQFVGRH